MRVLRVVAVMLVLSLALVGCGLSSGSEPEEGVLRVTCSWSEDVDLDLEIWTGDGAQQLAAARAFGPDETTAGEEYFDFTDYGADGDYSTGTYVVAVYFVGGNADDDAGPHVTWTDPDGDEQQRVTAMDAQSDMWHVAAIDAETGEYADIDEFKEWQRSD